MGRVPIRPILEGELVISLRQHRAQLRVPMREMLVEAIETAPAANGTVATEPLVEDRDRLLVLSAELDSELFHRMKAFCLERRISIRQFLEAALRAYLSRETKAL